MTDSKRWEPRRRARRRALQALYQWQMTGQEASAIISQFLETQDFETVDLGFFKALVTGVVDEHQELGERLQPFMDRPLQQCDVMERIILLLGAWQLTHEPELPFQVVLDECIELAKRFGSDQSPVFVNGVLDKSARAWNLDTSGV